MSKHRLLVIGHGRHGKSSVCDWINHEFGLSYTESSKFCIARLYPAVADLYPNWRAAYEDRHSSDDNRKMWEHLIAAYNLRPGPSLAEQIYKDFDIYCGLRRADEFLRDRALFDIVIYVDASERVNYVDPTFGISKMEADYVVDNNGLEGAYREGLREFLQSQKIGNHRGALLG